MIPDWKKIMSLKFPFKSKLENEPNAEHELPDLAPKVIFVWITLSFMNKK